MEVFPSHLDSKFVKIIKIITVFGFPILGPILGPIFPLWAQRLPAYLQIGDHTNAAQMLLRVAKNIQQFPAHVVPILTSVALASAKLILHPQFPTLQPTLQNRAAHKGRIGPKIGPYIGPYKGPYIGPYRAP